MAASYSDNGNEPDFEGMMFAREEARGERYLKRMDNEWGRVEDYLPKGPICKRCGEQCVQTWFRYINGTVCFDCATDDEIMAGIAE